MNNNILSITLDEALIHIADPYTMLGVPLARGVCAAFEVDFPEHLIVRWTSRNNAIIKYDIYVQKDEPGEGVSSSKLSDYVAVQYGVAIIEHKTRTKKQRAIYNHAQLEKKLKEKFQREEDNNNVQ